MAYSVCMQDWISITNSNTGAQNLTQAEADWLDISDYQDIEIFLDVNANTAANAVTLVLQTSPTKEEVFFGASQSAHKYLASFTIGTSSSAVGQQVQAVRWALGADQLPARYLRWQLQFPSTSTGTVTFRIWLVLNQAGWRGGTNMSTVLNALRS